MSEPVLVRERRGAVQLLRLNRPEARNSLNAELINEIGLGLKEAEEDPEVRCVVLTGRVDRASAPGWTCGGSPKAPPGPTQRRGRAGVRPVRAQRGVGPRGRGRQRHRQTVNLAAPVAIAGSIPAAPTILPEDLPEGIQPRTDDVKFIGGAPCTSTAKKEEETLALSMLSGTTVPLGTSLPSQSTPVPEMPQPVVTILTAAQEHSLPVEKEMTPLLYKLPME